MEEVLAYWPILLKGTITTIELTLASAALALVISFVVGLSRISKYRTVRVVATIYLEFFRGTSALVQLFFMYYVLPLWGLVFAPLTAGYWRAAAISGATAPKSCAERYSPSARSSMKRRPR